MAGTVRTHWISSTLYWIPVRVQISSRASLLRKLIEVSNTVLALTSCPLEASIIVSVSMVCEKLN